MNRLNVLLSAYACEPGSGSESGVGWNVALALARHCEIWVLTRANNRPAIEAELRRSPEPSLHFVYFDLPRWARFWKRRRRGVQLYYYLWQIGAAAVARNLTHKHYFDVVHHVTFVKYWAPSFLALLPRPFVWGPLGGGDSTPRGLWGHLSGRGRLYERFRELARSAASHDPFLKMTARRARVALAVTERTAECLRELGAKDVALFGQCALSENEIRQLASFPLPPEPVRYISLGELVHHKGYSLALKAFARADIDAQYWIVGDGPERSRLERLARELSIGEKVTFWGRLERNEALEKLGSSHILLHPSLHDSGGWACTEAIAAGRPVICLDCAGPAAQVTAEIGARIAPGRPVDVIRDLASAIRRMHSDHEGLARMSSAAKQRAEIYHMWSRKAEELVAIYAKAISQTC